ncbi:sensor histidine kinase [Bdellovibrio bacteriovorus]|uniref:histidine kinase n=1 Tax=Bdellovibrio bacteriovorus str. Tiberius TaxID=1069642 RepID=K7ZE04_BDEBC|nr:HAMP domain-containing sensor histidine kinase [Bdellovibrio bacteriovorus]AFY00027.1 hypothetical protein Bdt_0318 [Bdellovibrio bacteriovorus str. Tiberius]
MSFSKKIFLAIFGTAVFSALTVCLVLNTALSSHRITEFEESYIDHMNLLAGTLVRLEGDQAKLAMNNLLEDMIHHDVDNLNVELFGPENENLGKVTRPEFEPTFDSAEMVSKADGAYWRDGRMVVLTSLEDKSGKEYRLVTTISAATIEKELNRIKYTLLGTAAALILFSLWLSRVLTRTLLRKVNAIYTLLAEITQTQDYSKRVNVAGEESGEGPGRNSRDELDGLGRNLNHMLQALQASQSRLLEAERDKARSQVAAQVAHDIRSPLMSMNMALSQIENAPMEPLAILKSAVARVAGIVQKLSASIAKQDQESGVEAPKLTLVEPLIASVVNEHSVRLKPVQELTLTGVSPLPEIWSVLQVNELQSAISNLINNAFEAGATKVDLVLGAEGKKWTLQIRDNGKGIPAAILEKIFERSFTSGKAGGSGLGLFQAKAAIEWTGGTLEVSTVEGEGTVFTMKVPKEKNPAWLAPSIEVALDQKIFFVDDDLNVLSAWQAKAAALGLTAAAFYSSVDKFLAEVPVTSLPESALLIIDQNLNGSKTGLEILEQVALAKRAYLCTSEFDEKWVQDRVRKLNVHLIPKPWISQFELKVRTS